MLYFDQYTNDWALHPYFAEMFSMQYNIVQELREIVNQKWTAEQSAAYVQFLNDLTAYISGYVFNRLVHYHEDFFAWVEQVKQFNPVGVDLYEKQLDYYQKKMEGYDFKQDKKNKNKDPNAVKVEKEKPAKPVEEKERVIIRQGDPEINLEKLVHTDWDTNKYLSTSFLAKENANIVFIGHVDSGKSTLTGNIMRELKEVDEM